MDSRIWANASPSMDVYADQPDPDETGADECRIPGCGRSPHARGFCATHYKLLQRHGDPEGSTVARRNTLIDRAGELAGDDSPEAKLRMVRAAAEYGALRVRPWVEPPTVLLLDVIALPAARRVFDLAVRFADFPAEAPQAAFEAVLQELERAAVDLARVVCRPRGEAA